VTEEGDPFAVLGLQPGASLAEVRAARRRLAFEEHPDRGGDARRMQEINRAFERVVASLTGRTVRPGSGSGTPEASPGPTPAPPPAPAPSAQRDRGRTPRGPRWVERDEPSFTIDVLPVEAFEVLLIVAATLGEVLVDDPPYLLDAHLLDPAPCWCRLGLLPDAGGTTVIVTVAGIDSPPPPVEDVRDRWIDELNALGS
jgi:hypothetical protein